MKFPRLLLFYNVVGSVECLCGWSDLSIGGGAQQSRLSGDLEHQALAMLFRRRILF